MLLCLSLVLPVSSEAASFLSLDWLHIRYQARLGLPDNGNELMSQIYVEGRAQKGMLGHVLGS